MRTSSASIAKIASFEGCRLSPYNDAAGNATVGVGHLLHRGPLDGTEVPITEAQALSLFAQDLVKLAEVYILSFVHVPLNQNQYDALVSFTYNLACGTLKNLASETGLNQGNYARVPQAILEYDKAHVQGQLVALPGLTRRRQWEAQLFSAPAEA